MPNIVVPEIRIPDIKVPAPKVTVNVPPIKVPNLVWPEDEMPIRGWVQLMGVDLGHPLPVQLRDAKGNPISLFENLTQIVSGGGLAKIVKVSEIIQSVPVVQASGAIDSVNVTQLAGNTTSVNAGDADSGTLRIVQARSSSATTTSVGVGADASTSIVLTNLSRKSVILTHTSTSTLYVATGAASSTSSLPIVANQIVGFDDYTGPVNAIAEEGAGTISVRYIEVI